MAHPAEATETTRVPRISRRGVVSAFAVTSATAWVAPTVLTLDRVAAAVGSATPPAVGGAVTNGTLLAGQSLLPTSVTWSSNSQIFLFEEECVTLAAGQNTDSGMVLPTGVQITSHLIHFSPSTGTASVAGTVNFSGTIVGYDWKDGTLAAGDATWGVPGVDYGTTRRRMEGNDTFDVTLPSSIDLDLYAAAAYNDQVRVYVVY